MASTARVRRVGARAVLVDVEPGTAAGWRRLVLRLVREGLLPAPDDVVPGHATLLVDGCAPDAVSSALAGRAPAPVDLGDPRRVDVPVVYDGEDLAEVARSWGTDVAGVVAAHSNAEYVVDFCGFAPGFAYLSGSPGAVARRATPRTRVPAGAVGLAGRWCGVYPTASPGGWQLVGRTGLRLFDPRAAEPALLAPGTRVRFVPVDAQPAVPDLAPVLTTEPGAAGPAGRTLAVVRAGTLTTVQDLGRPGLAHLGVPRAGALDGPAARLANRLVGNREAAAVLETTVDGVAVRLDHPTTVAVTGAVADVRLDGRAAEWGVAVPVPAGAVVDVGRAVAGVRSYLAVAGGLEPPPTLGGRAHDTLSGLGPAPVSDGSVLPVGAVQGAPADVAFTVPAPTAEVLLRLRPGPDREWLARGAYDALRDATWRVSPDSNRVAARLVGPHLAPARDDQLDSAGLVLGAVQVPPDGQPVVMLADHPTTGGYPVVGVVEPADLAALAQARPGVAVRLRTEGDW